MKKVILIFFIGILVLTILQPPISPDSDFCEACEEYKDLMEKMGYSNSYIDDELDSYGCCDECPGLCPYTNTYYNDDSVCICIIGIIVVIILIIIIYIAFIKPKDKQIIYQEKVTRHCPQCGRPISMDADICPYCGKDFRIKK